MNAKKISKAEHSNMSFTKKKKTLKKIYSLSLAHIIAVSVPLFFLVRITRGMNAKIFACKHHHDLFLYIHKMPFILLYLFTIIIVAFARIRFR